MWHYCNNKTHALQDFSQLRLAANGIRGQSKGHCQYSRWKAQAIWIVVVLRERWMEDVSVNTKSTQNESWWITDKTKMLSNIISWYMRHCCYGKADRRSYICSFLVVFVANVFIYTDEQRAKNKRQVLKGWSLKS